MLRPRPVAFTDVYDAPTDKQSTSWLLDPVSPNRHRHRHRPTWDWLVADAIVVAIYQDRVYAQQPATGCVLHATGYWYCSGQQFIIHRRGVLTQRRLYINNRRMLALALYIHSAHRPLSFFLPFQFRVWIRNLWGHSACFCQMWPNCLPRSMFYLPIYRWVGRRRRQLLLLLLLLLLVLDSGGWWLLATGYWTLNVERWCCRFQRSHVVAVQINCVFCTRTILAFLAICAGHVSCRSCCQNRCFWSCGGFSCFALEHWKKSNLYSDLEVISNSTSYILETFLV